MITLLLGLRYSGAYTRRFMRICVIPILLVCLAGCQSKPTPDVQSKTPATQTAPAPAAPQEIASGGNPPETILIASPYGNVTFTHAKHYERVNGDCSVCHPKVFPQSLAPLNYKKAKHRAAEASMTSCAHCHAVGGTSFAADSNCTKCHAPREYPR
jgi:c(7)-type cytochrome triheme protein